MGGLAEKRPHHSQTRRQWPEEALMKRLKNYVD
jgi:hypothetical protein